MSHDLNLHIEEGSRQAQNIEALASAGHVSREEAALKLLAGESRASEGLAPITILGAFSTPSDISLLDDGLSLAMEDRERRNAS